MSALGVPFAKGHGTENDFVVLFDPERAVDLTPGLVRSICDRRTGVGGDGVLRAVLATADPEGVQMSDRARWFMDYRNADGSPAEMCGNGIRVLARYLVRRYLEPAGDFAIATRGGAVGVRAGLTGAVFVEMGAYKVPADQVKVAANGRAWPATPVLVPNPHAVAFVDDLDEIGDLSEAPAVEPAGAFPDGVNVEFAVTLGAAHLAMRVHERGVGETRSCGTGACAVAVAAAQRGPAPDSYVIDVPGGRLRVALGGNRSITLIGPAEIVATGVLDGEWLAAHR